jgi:membrane-bound inhibitor of C-type lysozyme
MKGNCSDKCTKIQLVQMNKIRYKCSEESMKIQTLQRTAYRYKKIRELHKDTSASKKLHF